MELKATTALRKIASLKKRIKAIQGGQGASKTFSVLMLLINHANSKPDREILIASDELSKMRNTVIKDFVKIMKLFNIYEDARFTSGTLYRFPNGSFIKFIGLDKEDIGKGLRSHIIFVNEANKVKFETYRELTSRAEQVIIDFNPNKAFWFHEEIKHREDCDFLILTYKDNEFLGENEKQEIENYYKKGYDQEGNVKNEYWANKWRVYGLGLEGKLDGTIFQNWVEGEFDNTLPFGYCVDFGYKNPFTVTKVAIKGDKMYLKEVIYQSGLSPKMISELMAAKGIEKNAYMVADSADPTMLRQFKNEGYNVYAAVKDKVINGIRAMQNYEIIIDPSSYNVIREFSNYTWLDKAGEIPIDDFNHVIDPVRYYEKFYTFKLK